MAIRQSNAKAYPPTIFPAGTSSLAGLPIGAPTSGWSQLSANTLSAINSYQGSTANQNYGLHILDNKGLLIGPSTPVALLPNQSGLEIDILNTVAGGVGYAFTIGQWGPDSAASEPMIFYRSRGATLGASGAVQASDSLGSLQFQGDLGDGTANVAAANIIGRVQPGSTPGTGNTRALAGNIVLATAPGNGTTPITSRLEIQEDGDVNIVGGAVQLNGTTVIDSTGVLTATGFRTLRSAIADDSVLVFQPYGGSTAFITLVSTNTAATNAPAGTYWARVNSLTVPQNLDMLGNTGVTYNTGVLSGTTGTDGKLNLSVDASGNCYIENRLGSSRTYSIMVMGGGA